MARLETARSPWWLAPGPLLATILLLAGCSTSLPTQRPWTEVRSENFTITSCVRPKDTMELAQRLELFRAAVLAMTTVDNVEPAVPTYIYAFDSGASFRAFNPNRAEGYIIPNMRGNYVALVDRHAMASDTILKHEYTHFLVRNRTSLVYPKWFDEGFAEFMSTVDVRDGYVVVGLISKVRAPHLSHTPWIPMRKILAFTGAERWTREDESMFYSQAWLFVHYLMRDDENRVRFSATIGRYLDRIEAGDSIEAASQAAFGMAPRDLDDALQRYMRKGSFTTFGVKEAALEWSPKTTSHKLGEADVAQRLGVLAWHGGDMETAGRLFGRAIELAPEHARALAGMGDVARSRDALEEAGSYFDRAVELDPTDPLNHLDMGEYWHGRAIDIEDPAERHDMLRTARRHYVRAYELNEERPEPYAVYGQTFLVEGQDPAMGVETLEHAANLLPSDLRIRLWLAEAYVRLDRGDEARPLLETIVAWGHESTLAERARALLAELDGGVADPEVAAAE